MTNGSEKNYHIPKYLAAQPVAVEEKDKANFYSPAGGHPQIATVGMLI